MNGLSLKSDVAIAGAGPVGCITALSFARQGAKVLLLEANPAEGVERLSGEWLHPPALQVLESLNLKLPHSDSYATGEGYVVFPDDGTEPIVLNYPEGLKGRSVEHKLLVLALREAVEAHPSIQFLSSARATHLEGNQLTFMDTVQGSLKTVTAGQIVGADGRASVVRKQLGHPNGRAKISLMAGILLENAELPFEGYGHVLLGGPGPALVFRISPHSLRVCLDVPSKDYNAKEASAYLWKAYSPILPPTLLPAFQEALQKRILWAPNQFRSRTYYGEPGIALVGDAVGHFHPLTAAGLTLGFKDAECLARSQNFEEYRKERSALTYVLQLLADSLYQVFTRQDAGSAALRNAIYRTWRQNPSERERTMRILAGLETNVDQFRKAFLKMMRSALPGVLHHTLIPKQWGSKVTSVKGFLHWFKWIRTQTSTLSVK